MPCVLSKAWLLIKEWMFLQKSVSNVFADYQFIMIFFRNLLFTGELNLIAAIQSRCIFQDLSEITGIFILEIWLEFSAKKHFDINCPKQETQQ